MEHTGTRAWRLTAFAFLAIAVTLVLACGVSTDEFNTTKDQLAALQREATAAKADVAAQKKEITDLQQELLSKLNLDAGSKLINDKFTTFEKGVPLWDIQPGTATRMAEITRGFNLMWFAAQAGNWEFAGFEVYRAGEQVKGILVTRPGRTEAINEWLPSLKTLEDAVKAKNKASFEKAYDDAIFGCNTCHAKSKGGGFEIKAIKITRPTTPLDSSIDFEGRAGS